MFCYALSARSYPTSENRKRLPPLAQQLNYSKVEDWADAEGGDSEASRVVCCALGVLAPPRLMRMKAAARVVKCYGNNEGGGIAPPPTSRK